MSVRSHARRQRFGACSIPRFRCGMCHTSACGRRLGATLAPGTAGISAVWLPVWIAGLRQQAAARCQKRVAFSCIFHPQLQQPLIGQLEHLLPRQALQRDGCVRGCSLCRHASAISRLCHHKPHQRGPHDNFKAPTAHSHLQRRQAGLWQT